MSHRISKSKFQKMVTSETIARNTFLGVYYYISCKCIRENVIGRLKNIGAETKSFGLYSLQAGDVTAAANLGANDRFFKKYRKWKPEKVKDGFIHESTEAKLIVTKIYVFSIH